MPSFSVLPPNPNQNRIFTPASRRAVAPDPHIEDFEEFTSRTQDPAQATRRTAPHIEDQPNNPWSTAAFVQRDIRHGNAVTSKEPPIGALSTSHPRFRNRRQLTTGREISNLSDYPATTTSHDDSASPAIGYGIPPTLTASQVNTPIETGHPMAPIHQISASDYAAMTRSHTSRTSPVTDNGIAHTSPLAIADAMSQLPPATNPARPTRFQEIQREVARVRSQSHEEFTREAARTRSRYHEQATRHHLTAFTNSGVPTSHHSRGLPAIRPRIPSAHMRSEDNAHVESQPATTPPTITRAQEINQEIAHIRTRHKLATHRPISAFDNSDIPSSHGNQTSSVFRAVIPSERMRRQPFTQEESQQPPRPPLQHPAFGSSANPTSHGTQASPAFRPVVSPTSMSPEEVGRNRGQRRLRSPLRYPSREFATPHDSRALPANRREIPPSRMTPEDASRNRNLRQSAQLRPYTNLDNHNIPTSNERQAPFSHATRQEHRERQTNTRAFQALERHARDIDPQRTMASLRSRIDAAGLAATSRVLNSNLESAFESHMRRIRATRLQPDRLLSFTGHLTPYPEYLPRHYRGRHYTQAQITAFIDSLPEVPISELDEQGKDCPCCYCTYEVEVNVDYGTPEKAIRLPCAYGKCILGKRCLTVHLGNTRAGTCPLCRRELEIGNGSDGNAEIGGIGGRGAMDRRGGVSRRGGVAGRGGSAATASVGASPPPWRGTARSLACFRAYEEERGSTEEADDDDDDDDEDEDDDGEEMPAL